jgi:putative glycosyltransferase (TIGR04372 family)
MWGRVMRVWPSHFTALVILINKMFKGWEKHEIGTNTRDRDPKNLLVKCKPHLKFTAEEIKRGEAQLKDWGLPDGAQWVCLMVRDAAYLSSPVFAYHAYRDCDVDTYEDAALLLAERGYYVFRMGKTVAKPFAAKHPRIRDFATDGTYSDFMGVYLGAYCAFCISTSTGWDAIPQAFRRPMCYANFAPFEYINTWLPNSLAIWKHHLKDGKRMSIDEISKSGAGRFMRVDQFDLADIKLVDNTPQEITEVVREMAEMVEGRFAPNDQKEFWDAFPRYFDPTDKQPLHGEIRTRIGSKFLEEYYAEQQADSGSNTSTRRIAAGSV